MDEGHELRTPTTSKYRRILELKAKSRWILSATPFRSWGDFFNLIQLLHFPLYNLMSGSLSAFKRCIQQPFQARLVKPVLEEAFSTLIFGHSAESSSIKRPTISFQKHVVDFANEEQKKVYESMREQVAHKYDGMRRAKTFLARPMEALALLQPLRRACGGCGSFFSPTEIEKQKDAQGKWFLLSEKPHKQKYREATQDSCHDVETEECSICLEPLSNPLQTKCRHLFCEECILSSLTVKPKCPQCREKLKTTKDEQNYATDLFLPKVSTSGSLSSGRNGKDSSGKAEAVEPASSGDSVVMNAKMNALVSILLNLKQEEPGAKSIVFSQFSESIDNLSRLFTSLGIKHAIIQGSFTQQKRYEGVCMDVRY